MCMSEFIKYPFFARLTFILLSLLSIGYICFIGQSIINPILMAFLFAILLRPLVYFFKSKLHFPHVIAVFIAVMIFVLVVVGIFAFISMQISEMTNDIDKIQKNFAIHLEHIQHYVKENFHISSREQKKYIADATQNTIEKGKEVIGSTLMSFTDVALNVTLVPIYTFLILLYRTHFILFLSKLFKKEDHSQLEEILEQIKVSVKSYIIGLIIEMIAVSILTAIGFWIIGLEYFILLGIITGILNLIPYVGILFAGLLSIVASLTGSPELSIIIGVIVVNIIVQLIDNNILMPLIINSKVEINAFVSIVGIIIGGSLMGITGMFLAIPIIAILKVIFDRIKSLEPWGYLMGDDLPKTYEWHHIRLPRYDYGNSNDTIIIKTEIKEPLFTSTTTSKEVDQ